jgi:hypothetical protein
MDVYRVDCLLRCRRFASSGLGPYLSNGGSLLRVWDHTSATASFTWDGVCVFMICSMLDQRFTWDGNQQMAVKNTDNEILRFLCKSCCLKRSYV